MLRKIKFKNLNANGVVLITTVVVLSLVVFACLTMATMVFNDIYTLRKITFATQAEYLAEAGIEEALKELHNNFTYTPTGFPKPLGIGEYDVVITPHPTDPDMKLIISTGKVIGVNRVIKAQVVYIGPEAFDYVAVGAGLLKIAGGSVIGTVAKPIQVHSNTTVMVGTGFDTGTVNGDASACSQVNIHPVNGIVTGTVTSNAAYVELPPFDDNFFQYYCNLASEDGKFYIGNQEFISDPCAGTANHVVYVQGEVRLEGTWEMTGCIVATGPIWINKKTHGKITQHKWENLPAFMSKDSNVYIWDPTDIEGMIYAGNEFHVQSSEFTSGPTNITGCVYGRGGVKFFAQTNMEYVKPFLPGLPEETEGVRVAYWGGG